MRKYSEATGLYEGLVTRPTTNVEKGGGGTATYDQRVCRLKEEFRPFAAGRHYEIWDGGLLAGGHPMSAREKALALAHSRLISSQLLSAITQ